MHELGLIDRLPRLAVIQAEGSAPFYDLHARRRTALSDAVGHPETLATAIKIGDPVSWPKALLRNREHQRRGGEGDRAGDRRCQGSHRRVRHRLRTGLGRTLAGIRKLRSAGVIAHDADVVAVLTGNVLKDPDYIFKYHTGV